MVSVIIPVYNGEEFIERAIKSILNQTYKHVEIIVVDDGSTDNTRQEVEKMMLSYSQIKLIENNHGGVCVARNTGINCASGEWVAFLDADDALFEDALEILIDRSKGFDIVSGRLTGGQKKEGTNSFVVLKGREPLLNYLEDSPIFYSACGKLFSKEFINDVRFREGRIINEDSFFNFECCLKKSNICYIDKDVYNYIGRNGSASRSLFSKKKYDDMLFFESERKRLIKLFYPELIDKNEAFVLKNKMCILWNTSSIFSAEIKRIEKEAKLYIRRNKKLFKQAIKKDKIMYMLVVFRIYWVYKVYSWLRAKSKLYRQVNKG